MRIYQLPQELLSNIYRYNDTYKTHFKKKIAGEFVMYVCSYNHRCEHALINGTQMVNILGEYTHSSFRNTSFTAKDMT